MNILITGATGTVGSEVIRQAINDPSVTQITLLTRRISEFDHPKMKQIIHKDFMNYTGLGDIFKQTDVCIWCLGISQSRVNKNQYYLITHDYVVAAAKAMLSANPGMAFLFLSGEGADSKERSPIRFARVKGQAENALIKLRPEKLFIFRPGGIVPTIRNRGGGLYKKFEFLGVKIMEAIFPWSVISTKGLALAMLKVSKEGYEKMIIGHKDIKKM